MSAPRPLPARPSLELERKHAKRLLRALLAGEPDALARTNILPAARRRRADWKLADAQLMQAREYGFTSWLQLVRYFETWARHEASGPTRDSNSLEHHEGRVRHFMALHRRRLPGGAQLFAAFVPRFIGKSNDEVYATDITEAEARLVAARLERQPNWDALVQSVPPVRTDPMAGFNDSPLGRATVAIRAGDLERLQAITAEHPEMLTPAFRGPADGNLLTIAWTVQRRTHGEGVDAIVAWLESHGLGGTDFVTRQLHRIWRNAKAIDFRFYLEKGADPAWVPPNGVTLIERAIMACWDPELVDLIATRVTPPDAFWIHAGLGDTAAMRRYLAGRGQVTAAAHERRPDFLAVNLPTPQRQEADDAEVLWEAFFIAGVNQRAAAIDLLLAHGVHIDTAPWGQPLLNFAVGNRMVRLVELLMERGASADVKGFMPTMTAREMAESALEEAPERGVEVALRIRELVGE